MDTQLKTTFWITLGVLFLVVGLAAGIWHYYTRVLPLRPALPVLKVLKSKNLPIPSSDSYQLVYNHFIYPNASNDLFTGYAAQTVRREFLKALRTREDPDYRYTLLWIILETSFPKTSRIQFEMEDWAVIEEAVERVNKEQGYSHSKRWTVYEHEGRKYLMLPTSPIP